MPIPWTSQRVVDLAPDASSASAGRGQAKASQWPLLGRCDIALWGEVQGSGKKPYQVRIDLREPAFKCSCPSRKFPCKHSLGLLLLLAEQPQQIAEGAPPDWVAEWLESRDERAEKQKATAETAAVKPVDAAAQAKRAANREAKVCAGVEQLGLLLNDVVRQGFAWTQTQPYSFWDNAAARLVDAQAAGLARLVRELGETVASGEGWQGRFLRRVARLHLAVEGYGRLDQLPGPTRADLRTLVGWTTSREELLTLPAEPGVWCVAGQTVEQEDRLTVQRTWLARESDGRPALVLDFAAPGAAIESVLAPGMAFAAELAYYPGSAPLRALIAKRDAQVKLPVWPGLPTIEAALAAYAAALAANPWLDAWPLTLDGVTIVPPAGDHSPGCVRDSEGGVLPLAPERRQIWPLVSLSGGAPVTLFGQWNGELLTLLAARSGDAYYTVTRGQQGPPLARVA